MNPPFVILVRKFSIGLAFDGSKEIVEARIVKALNQQVFFVITEASCSLGLELTGQRCFAQLDRRVMDF